MALEIEVSDVVWLRSGSPPMTVKEVRPGGMVACTWFTQAGELREALFDRHLLDDAQPTIFGQRKHGA